MASETVDPIDWSHPPPSWAVPPELHVLHGVNAAYKPQDLLHQPGLERASTGMPDQRTILCGHSEYKGSVLGSQPLLININYLDTNIECWPLQFVFTNIKYWYLPTLNIGIYQH